MRADVGICMDVGHALMMGDVVDAIETCSGHLVTTHLHDNRGQTDDHLVPGKGVIDWAAALLALQKVGYDGVVDVRGRQRVERKAGAREGREGARTVRIAAAHRRRDAGTGRAVADLGHLQAPDDMHAHYIDKIGEHVGADRHHQGLAAQPPVERQDSLPRRPRRHRLSAGRDGQERRRRRDVPERRSPVPGERRSSSPARCERTSARKGGYELIANGLEVVERGARLPHHAEGARRRLPDGSPAPVDSRRAADGDPARAPRNHQRRPRLLQRARASSSPTRRSSRRRRAKARRRCSRCSTSRTRRRI